MRILLTIAICLLGLPSFSQRKMKLKLKRNDGTHVLYIKYKGEKGDLVHFQMTDFYSPFSDSSISYLPNKLSEHDSLITPVLSFQVDTGWVRYSLYSLEDLGDTNRRALMELEKKDINNFSSRYGSQKKRQKFKIPLVINPEIKKIGKGNMFMRITVTKGFEDITPIYVETERQVVYQIIR